MIATYVARVTLESEADLGEVEKILESSSFTEPNMYVTSTAPMVMLVSPYKDSFGREVRSFELTDYLVKEGLLPKEEKTRPVT